MKKTTLISSALAVLTISSMATNALAALPGGGWWTSFTVQNVDTGTANVAYSAYWQEGQGGGAASTVYTQQGSITVTEGSSIIYNPGLAPNYPTGPRVGFSTGDSHLPAGFAGGLELSSDKQMRAVVQVGNNPNGTVGTTGGTASGFYQGVLGSDIGTSLLFPVMKHNYFGQTTNFYIQAAGGPAVISGSMSYSGTTSYFPTNINIAAGKTYLVDPAALGVPAAALGVFNVSAVSGQIAGSVIEAQHSATVATFALSTKGFAPSEFDTTIFIPTNKLLFFGGSTGLQIQNTTGTAATAVVTFTVTNVAAGTPAATAGIAPGMTYVANVNIPANGFYLFSRGNGNYINASTSITTAPALADGVFFTGVAVASQPIVATVNEANGARRLVYSTFPASRATTKIAAPLVKEDFANATTGLTVQNVGTASTNITAEYICGASTYNLGPFAVAAGAGFALNDLNNATRWGSELVPSNSNCAVTVTSDGQPIVGLPQESTTNGVDFRNYEAFNLAP